LPSHSGVPIWYSGPHLPRHDSYLFEAYPPPFTALEKALCDLAYIKMDRLGQVITPFKRRRRGELTELQETFNSVHSWFRVTVEHTNAAIRSFKILGSRYRGEIFGEDTFLADAISISINTTAPHTMKIPLRVHHQLPGFPPVGGRCCCTRRSRPSHHRYLIYDA